MGDRFLQVNNLQQENIANREFSLIILFSLTGLSVLIGIAIKFAQRNRTQAEYAQLDRVGEMSMEPFVTNEELGQDALLGSSPSSSNQEINNQTESTLLPPPTEESNLEFENQGYKSQSSSGLSTDTDEFRSLNDTVTEIPSAVTPEPATMPAATSTPRQEPENEETPTPTVELQTPTMQQIAILHKWKHNLM